MNFYIILAHPESKSFNSSIANELRVFLENKGHKVKFNDLYKNNFNPLLSRENFSNQSDTDLVQFPKAQLDSIINNTTSSDIEYEHKNIQWSDIIILQFPLWLYGMPAILKGWCDRVLSEGFAHQPSKNLWFDKSLLNKKKILLSITTNGKRETYSSKGRHGSINIILWPIINAFAFSGINIIKPFISFDVIRCGQIQRKSMIEKLKKYTENINNAELVKIHKLNDYETNGLLKNNISPMTAGQQKPDDFIH
ncbi:MAG: hypothetical protein CMM49_06725 [Rhodospirillaceae bacterium]|nr:hypothetical protein [Rhodospirillaceae bacterium]|tara:strand:- start:1470 stop:2225 length:756 start_codon:yes stop_codon:yes gene_type:complete